MGQDLSKAALQELVNKHPVSEVRLIVAKLEGRDYPQKPDVFGVRLKTLGVSLPSHRKRRPRLTFDDLVNNSRPDACTKTVKSLCAKHNVFSLEVCGCCGRTEHNGKPIRDVLELDHKDGNHYNNRPENLWMICACCHTRQPTSNRSKGSPSTVTLIESQASDTSDGHLPVCINDG